MNLLNLKPQKTLCPTCMKSESNNYLPLFQKNGSILYEPGECDACFEQSIEEWLG